ncbi:hypothetical protein KGQ19_00690 [Catenulispora sp. NL8]|uniref:Uncharacterized protein n=1 Tax=Catenulispora pinistramenti TaxID=2705254 RepID=A0ABS5KJW9_9ACTN|nr:hypothetical protein [Catenulispora pinistramenti]MBS2545376.1 hypothetical protein [Catenulispora pinistramenti]
MTTIAVATMPGSRGATVAALALLYAWPLAPGFGVLLVDADPDVGPIRAGHGQTRIGPDRSMANLAVPAREGNLGQAITNQLINLGEDDQHLRLILLGFTDAKQATGFGYAWDTLAESLVRPAIGNIAFDVLIDLGRNGTTGRQITLARRADVVLAVVEPTLAGVVVAETHIKTLVNELNAHGAGPEIGLLVVEPGPLAPNRYSPNEVGRVLNLQVAGVLPHDPRTAAWLSHGGNRPKHLDRAELISAARGSVNHIQAMAAARSMRLSPAGPRSVTHG